MYVCVCVTFPISEFGIHFAAKAVNMHMSARLERVLINSSIKMPLRTCIDISVLLFKLK